MLKLKVWEKIVDRRVDGRERKEKRKKRGRSGSKEIAGGKG